MSDKFQFKRVDEFYGEFINNKSEWTGIQKIESCALKNIANPKKDKTADQVLISLMDSNNIQRFMSVDFITADIFRVRFNPSQNADYYTEDSASLTDQENDVSKDNDVTQQTYTKARQKIDYYHDKFPGLLDFEPHTKFDLSEVLDDETTYVCKSTTEDGTVCIQLVINREDLSISVLDMTYEDKQNNKVNNGENINKSKVEGKNSETERRGKKIWEADLKQVYFKEQLTYTEPISEDQCTECSVVMSVVKPATAKYIGFGEKGGFNLCKNSKQLSYFNFDNMRYESMHGQGPLDPREPLYHSNPFFIEYDGESAEICSSYGIFVNNPSQTLLDMGFTDSHRYMFTTMYGDMDFCIFTGASSKEILSKSTTLAGKARLKPRYVLGYHQGGYGYESTQALENVVNGYGGNDIPFDGLHVDVDIQTNYCTFTMRARDEHGNLKFAPDTFKRLKDFSISSGGMSGTEGLKYKIKCSTNITPVISNPYVMGTFQNDDPYRTFKSGMDNNYFVRYEKAFPDPNWDKQEGNYNGVYLGGVYYGGDRGTFGHYTDFGKRDARMWWGQQYKELYLAGLSMVWQDMTTPAISINQNIHDLESNGESWFNFSMGGVTKYGLSCNYKSFPFNLFLTDNFDTRYSKGEIADRKSPAGKIRNLYSYNLHKATYHGLNNLWKIHLLSFTWVIKDDKALTKTESNDILQALLKQNGILKEEISTYAYDCYRVISKNIETDVRKALVDFNFNNEVIAQICQVLLDSKELEKRKDERNFIIGRGGFSGMHRFGGLWTGDNASTWDFLKINVAQILALGLSGQPITGSDTGGFERPKNSDARWADPELIIRWTTLGAFLPWFRNHYIQKDQKEFQELYRFQDVAEGKEDRFMYESVLPVCRIYIKLRYQLMQMFYDAMFENTITGMPIVRPLFLQDDEDPQLFSDKIEFLNNQFFVGKFMMIAPIMDKQTDLGNGNYTAQRDIYFPYGFNWYQFQHNRRSLTSSAKGGYTINYDAAIDSRCTDPNSIHSRYVLPLFVREGAVIPSTEAERYVGAYYDDHNESMPVTLNCYPSPNCKKAEHRMYLDDGQSRSSAPTIDVEMGGDPEAKDEYRRIDIKQEFGENWNRTIDIERMAEERSLPNYNLCPYYYVAILHDPNEPIINDQQKKDDLCTIKVNGNTIPFYATTNNGTDIEANFNTSTKNVWYFNPTLNISFIKVFEERILTLEFMYNGVIQRERPVGQEDHQPVLP